MTLDETLILSIKMEKMKRENERMIRQVDRNIARIQEIRRKSSEFLNRKK